MKKVLVVVDVQKDFYHPDGALYVKGGEVLPERIAKVIPQFDDVLFTVDWHPYNHRSFIGNKNRTGKEGVWPVHCVAFSEGASLPKEFIPFIIHNNTVEPNVITKGEHYLIEEYGADADSTSYLSLMNYEKCEFVFCGIAGDYCVKETIFNFLERNSRFGVKVSVYLDGVASIDDGTTIREFMKENNIEEWKPQE